MPSRYIPNAKYDTARRAVKARSQLRTAVLGDDTQNIYADRVGFYFARPVLSADENGNGLLGPTFYLRANPAASILPKPGRKVKYKKDDDGLYVIVQADWDDMVQSGIDPIALEPNDPYQANRNLFEIVNLNSYSIGSGLLVNVYPWQYHTADNTVRLYSGTTASTQVDLTSYVPGSVDTHRYALLVFNVTAHIAGTNPLAVYASTPISAFTALTVASDLQDCYNQLPTTDIIVPIKAYYLQYGQTTIAGISKDLDVRQFINVPNIGVMKAFMVAGSSGTNPSISNGQTLNIVGAGGISTTGNSGTKTITIDGSGITGGITQLTGDVLAGPGSGSQASTLKVGVTIVSPVINTGVSGTAIDNDATFASPSSTTLPTTSAVKGYVDQTVLGLNAKADVRLATAAALPTLIYANGSSGIGATLTGVSTGILTVDGVTVAINNRILVKDQATGFQNGIYICTVAGAIGVAFVLTRTTDGDTDAELRGGWMVVIEGTVNSTQAFVNTNVSAITFGTTAITFGEFSASVITVTAPIVKTGNNLSLNSTVLIDTTAQNASNKTITASTIDSTPIGTTTRALGYFSALRVYIGGFAAIFTHANSADRTYTLPNYNATLSPGTTKGDLSVFNGSDNVRFGVPAFTSGRTILTDTSTSTGLLYDYTEVEVDATWATSGITNGKVVYQDETTALWSLMNTSNVGRLKGIVTDQGASLANNPGRVRVIGQYVGGAFGIGPIYASSTAGNRTSTEPTPTLNGNTIIIAQVGQYADGGMFTNGLIAPIFRTWLTLANAGVTSITHIKNRPSLTRAVNIRSVVYDVAVAETYASSNQDSASQLRGQSGAGSGNTIDTTGVTRGPIGDASGTDFRVAQSFQVTAAGKLSQFTVFADTTAGSPSGTINWSIQTNGATIPSGISLISNTIAGGSWTASANNTINVTGGPFLDTSTTYWLVLEMSAMQATNNAYSVRYNTAGGYASGVFKWDTTTGASFPGTWAGGGGANDMRCTVTTSALVTTDLLAQGVAHTAANIVVSSVKLWLKKTGTPTGTLTCAIYDDSGGSPNAAITNGTAGAIAASTLSTSYGYIEFLFPVAARPTLTASAQYHVVLSTSDSASNTNYVEWGSDNTSPSYANGELKTSISSVWASTSPSSDGCFELYSQTTSHYEEMPKALFTGGAGGCGVWYGDAAGANTETVTRVINNTGSGKEIVIDIVIPVQ